jgi:hypothetical protein
MFQNQLPGFYPSSTGMDDHSGNLASKKEESSIYSAASARHDHVDAPDQRENDKERTRSTVADLEKAAALSKSSVVVSQLHVAEDLLFPSKLYSMLHDAESNGFTHIVAWGSSNEDGCFRVHRKRDFERQILPSYFKMTKYKSFTRQLHNYGFVWIRHGPDKGGCEFLVLLLC